MLERIFVSRCAICCYQHHQQQVSPDYGAPIRLGHPTRCIWMGMKADLPLIWLMHLYNGAFNVFYLVVVCLLVFPLARLWRRRLDNFTMSMSDQAFSGPTLRFIRPLPGFVPYGMAFICINGREQDFAGKIHLVWDDRNNCSRYASTNGARACFYLDFLVDDGRTDRRW